MVVNKSLVERTIRIWYESLFVDHLCNLVDTLVDSLIKCLERLGDGQSHIGCPILVHLLQVVIQFLVVLEVPPHIWLVKALENDEDHDHVEQEEKHDAAGKFEDDLRPQSHVVPVCGAHLSALPALLCLLQPILLFLADRDVAEVATFVHV